MKLFNLKIKLKDYGIKVNNKFKIHFYEEDNDEMMFLFPNKIKKRYKKECGDGYSGPDEFIAIMEYLFHTPPEKNIKIDYYGNFFWLIHDLLHATHDTSGCTIYIDGETEKKRLLQAECYYYHLKEEILPYEFLDKIGKEFNTRFKSFIHFELTESLSYIIDRNVRIDELEEIALTLDGDEIYTRNPYILDKVKNIFIMMDYSDYLKEALDQVDHKWLYY